MSVIKEWVSTAYLVILMVIVIAAIIFMTFNAVKLKNEKYNSLKKQYRSKIITAIFVLIGVLFLIEKV